MSRLDPASPSADDPGSLPEFETLISELSSRFIDLAPGEVDGEIENALRRVCAPLGIDRALLWQWTAATPDVIRPTHGYYARESLRTAEGPLNQAHFPWVIGQMRAGRAVVLADVEAAPAEAAVDRAAGLHRTDDRAGLSRFPRGARERPSAS